MQPDIRKNTLAMEQTNMKKAFIQLHLSVLLSGFTGLFGKLITLNETTLTWYRIFFTAVILLVFTGLPKVGWKKVLQIAGCGTLLGFHWLLFYASIKASNVSIGVVCFASFSFDSRYRVGIAIGILSAAVCSLYAVTNKKVAPDIKARTMLLYEMVGGLVGVSVIIPSTYRYTRPVSPWPLYPMAATCGGCYACRCSARWASTCSRHWP